MNQEFTIKYPWQKQPEEELDQLALALYQLQNKHRDVHANIGKVFEYKDHEDGWISRREVDRYFFSERFRQLCNVISHVTEGTQYLGTDYHKQVINVIRTTGEWGRYSKTFNDKRLPKSPDDVSKDLNKQFGIC